MLLATYLKIAIFALATVPVGFARPLTSGSGGANTDLQFRDEQIDTRELVVDDIYGRDLADDYVSARELNNEAQELELRQWAAIAKVALRQGVKQGVKQGVSNSNNNDNKPKKHGGILGFFGF